MLGQQAAAAYAVGSGTSNPEDVNAPVFNVSIDRPPVNLQQSCCVWNSHERKTVSAERAPDILAREDGVIHVIKLLGGTGASLGKLAL